MRPFEKITSHPAYIPIANIDTDMLIPKQYLKTIKRTGLGQYLFAELRYDLNGNIIRDFILNRQPDTKILIAGENFGCGSSREHAPWALLDFGISVIIAPSYADIFYNNCFKNGILPIILEQRVIDSILDQDDEVRIDLPNQTIKCGSVIITFKIDSNRKEILIKGLDDIEKIMHFKKEISQFEQRHFTAFPWLESGDCE